MNDFKSGGEFMQKHKLAAVLIALSAVVIIAVAAFSAISHSAETANDKGGREMIVGKNVSLGDVTEFYYTYSSSSNPPDYKRYHFYVSGDSYMFYYEKREGDHWPLKESDITASKTMELSEEEWARFTSLIEGGKVKKRSDNAEAGDAGPWLYLYWQGDRGKYQEFAFESYTRLAEFEQLCSSLEG